LQTQLIKEKISREIYWLLCSIAYIIHCVFTQVAPHYVDGINRNSYHYAP
jgi:hypothetical protein